MYNILALLPSSLPYNKKTPLKGVQKGFPVTASAAYRVKLYSL
jgi:hypothetical protein